MKWKKGKELSNRKFIAVIEELWSVKLPPEFVILITENNSARPVENIFDTEDKKELVFGQLLDFDLNEKNNVLEHQVEGIPTKVFPFAIDPGGNYICFDYREGDQLPKIVFWNHEGIRKNGLDHYQINFIANSFREFINKLHRYDSDETETYGFERLA